MRVGMHAGIPDPSDVHVNKTAGGRVAYGGTPLALAKAVGDVGHGGQVGALAVLSVS